MLFWGATVRAAQSRSPDAVGLCASTPHSLRSLAGFPLRSLTRFAWPGDLYLWQMLSWNQWTWMDADTDSASHSHNPASTVHSISDHLIHLII